MRVRSPSTICWLPGLPPGTVVGLEIISGPLPLEPPVSFGVISCGVIATEAVVEGCVKLLSVLLLLFLLPTEPQATDSKNTISKAPPSTNFLCSWNITLFPFHLLTTFVHLCALMFYRLLERLRLEGSDGGSASLGEEAHATETSSQ